MNLKNKLLLSLTLITYIFPTICMHRAKTNIRLATSLLSKQSNHYSIQTTPARSSSCYHKHTETDSEELINKKKQFEKIYEVSETFCQQTIELLEIKPFQFTNKDLKNILNKEKSKTMEETLHNLHMLRIEQLRINFDVLYKEIEKLKSERK